MNKMADKKELQKWADETVNIYKNQPTNLGFYTQTPLVDIQNPELLILGINPGCGGGKENMTGEELLKGNPCFAGKNANEIIYALLKKRDPQKRKYGWNLMKKIHEMLFYAGKQELLENLDKFVLSNMIFFGTAKQGQIPKGINQEICAKQTLDLIDKLEPNVVLLLGEQCRFLFEKVANFTPMEMLAPNYHVFYSFYKTHHIIAIYHTSYYRFYTSNNMIIVGNIIGYALDNPSRKINKEELELFLSEKTNTYNPNSKIEGDKLDFEARLKLFKEKIDSSGADNCKLAYNGSLLNYEFYTQRHPSGKLIDSKDKIAIDLLIDDNDYLIRVGTRRNDPEKSKEVAMAIDGEFRPGNTILTAHYWHMYKKVAQSISNDEMIQIMNELINKVRSYRDKTYTL